MRIYKYIKKQETKGGKMDKEKYSVKCVEIEGGYKIEIKGSVKCVEIEGGYKIEIKGSDLKGLSAGCCVPLVVKCGDSKSECCPPEEKKDNP
jgi:hypothetical protein